VVVPPPALARLGAAAGGEGWAVTP
jgi:hypothetical protein